MLDCVAVGITDEKGTLLSWDGEADHHYPHLLGAIMAACEHGSRQVVAHEDLFCPHRGSCVMRTAVIVPRTSSTTH